MKLLTIATLILAGASTSAVALDKDREDDDGHHRWTMHGPMGEFVMAGGPMRWVEASAAHRWEELDVDEDGRVSRDEYMSAKTARFEELDADEDGYIDEDELEDFVEARVEKRMDAFNERMEDSNFSFELDMDDLEDQIDRATAEVEVVIKGMKGSGMHRMVERLGQRFEELDQDEDGEVTREEFMARREKAFERLDEDGDGVISEEELEEGGERFMSERMGRPRRFRFRSN